MNYFKNIFFKKSVDGIIISNTTIQRPSSLISENRIETGGLSGRPLKELSNKVTLRFYELTNGKLPIIGAGGIETGQDALERIKSGASLIQIYTSMVYEGPIIVNKIRRELVEEMSKQSYKNISEAIGVNFKNKKF
jgi:dihydroorotate dehydrogenase